ncbi:heterokaryon incompatibility protein-domain-containing protein [Hypoxylon trugodes]|uniref:heterokaryon incompatibility protein-domain-containing protein n=1 Tax=Hypoxylon trugodes TaxID=326681 RepID=UPI00219D5484|nr:heterokaryon incompatibility protein-domain-containing protein [Hypoxylon trugodes]KAI1390503.1 heterokaryon incompatibility protein-domain-containing protein [Hypoxylon trugodes]
MRREHKQNEFPTTRVQDEPYFVAMEKSANTVNYDPLPSDGSMIRLVTILPGVKHKKVKCTVANYPFSKFSKGATGSVEYEALSYVWGDASITNPITLNGQPFRVTINLEAALRALRLQDKRRHVWIDAMCINQTNLQERNQEVRRMGDIYSNARQVIVWLGREVEPGDVHISDDRVTQKTHSLLNSLADASPQDPDAAARVLDRTGNTMQALLLLHKFFYRPWFQRIWILQEIALARTATIVFGGRGIGWDRLLQAVDALRRLQLGSHTHIWRLSGGGEADRVQRCWMRRRTATSQGELEQSIHFELADLLWQTRFYKCTEPRDRLYGILGLVKGDLSGEKLLEVDYTKSVAEIFRDLSIFMIKGGKLSHVLCAVTEDTIDGLPSWATAWIAKLEGTTASKLSNGIVMHMQSYEFKGIEQPPNPPRLSVDSQRITIKGFIFDDSIRHVSKHFNQGATTDYTLDRRAKLIRTQLTGWQEDMECQRCAQEIFKTRAERCEAWKHAILHELPGDKTELGQHYDLLMNHEDELPSATESALILRLVTDLDANLGLHCDFRRPFITRSGLMGSTGTSCDVHLEDKLCVFVGSAVPYLLRPIDEAKRLYRFVTCCWVPGLLDLDLEEGQKRGLWKIQDITLV